MLPKDATWAITAYFDPLDCGNRLETYREFRRNLRVPLVAVELSFDDRFDLGPGDADILIQVRGDDVLWQKERMLNIGLRALPDRCDAVAWLDCDSVFVREDWVAASRRQLENFALVQPFERLHYLDRNDPPRLPDRMPSGLCRFTSPGEICARATCRKKHSAPRAPSHYISGMFQGWPG